ncbi:MAG TPA: hypothetical protein VED84_05655 [Acidimicrobiales bacterium]|nr:hypothetical protein [Acidimicrobiales bacterium]
MTEPLTLEETADLLGRYRYVELTLFTRLGARAPACGDAKLVVYLAGASRAHGFRAALVESLIPVASGLPDAAALTRSPGRHCDEALDVLDGPGDDDELLDALVACVYPAMAAAYAEHLVAAPGPADPATRRTLHRVLADLDDVTTEGRELGAQGGGSPRALRVRELVAAVPGPFGPLHGRS